MAEFSRVYLRDDEDIGGQVKQVMLNITTLMNCLECEKCRLWGKVQTTGLAVALDIASSPAVELSHAPLLSRPKLVALVNLFRQITEAIYLSRQCP